MASGMEMMFGTMLKNAIANLPPEIKQTIDNIGQTVLTFKDQLNRIEHNQIAIIRSLGIQQEIENHGTRAIGTEDPRHSVERGNQGERRNNEQD